MADVMDPFPGASSDLSPNQPAKTVQQPTPEPYGRERRREHRRIVQEKARLTVIDGPSAGRSFEITTRNISLSGICFLLPEPLRVGQLVRIQITTTAPSLAPGQICEVVRSRLLSNGRYEMAVQVRKGA